jgi:hypothetical protein
MALDDKSDRTGQGATVAQIKHDIDTGRTGDKAGGFDPAASPLGTDEEAGGAPHDPALIAKTRTQEREARPQSTSPNAATPELQPDARAGRTGLAIPILIGIAAAAVLAAMLLMFL